MTLNKAYLNPISGGRQLIIGDIHGCSLSFDHLLRKIDLQRSDQLILLGDLINKGPDSKGVIDKIMALQADEFNVYVIRGNNESMLMKVLKKPENRIEQLAVRFRVTNLFKKDKWKMKKKYKAFLKSTLFYIESDEFFAVHAGFDYTSYAPFNDTFQMLWMRDFTPDKIAQRDKPVFYGHRVFSFNKIRKKIKKGKLALPLDNGCVLGTDDPKFGRLICYDFTNKELIYQENVDEVIEQEAEY